MNSDVIEGRLIGDVESLIERGISAQNERREQLIDAAQKSGAWDVAFDAVYDGAVESASDAFFDRIFDDFVDSFYTQGGEADKFSAFADAHLDAYMDAAYEDRFDYFCFREFLQPAIENRLGIPGYVEPPIAGI